MENIQSNLVGEPANKISPLGYPLELLAPKENLESVTETIGSIVLKPRERQPKAWFYAAAGAFTLLMIFFCAIAWLFYRGVGIWGISIPVAWGFAIVNFVWWVGIGHAGTFISAILLLLHQKWRTAINRFTETMTLCAISCAGLFPLLHLGRPWVFFWMIPYPDTMGLWPQFRSPLVWDMFAVGTYFLVSLMFWYSGLIPDLATLRDRAQTRGKKLFYGFFALGWRNSAIHWQRHQSAYLLLAGVATPLVLSVHSVVGMDFAVANLPGWHETIIPPYFVAGAIYSGFAMMLNIVIPIRKLYGLQNLITQRHLNNIGNVMLVLGNMVAYSYIMEEFMAWYQRRHFRAKHDGQPRVRRVWLDFLGADCNQHFDSAIVVVEKNSHESRCAFFCRAVRKSWNVGGSFSHHCRQPHARFCSRDVENVLPDDLGLGDDVRQRRTFFNANRFVRPLSAGNCHV